MKGGDVEFDPSEKLLAIDEATHLYMSFDLDVFNSSELPRAMRDAEIVFFESNRKELASYSVWLTPRMERNGLKSVSLPAKEVTSFYVELRINNIDEMEKIRVYKKVKFRYKNHKGKRKTEEIKI